jgi:hypothetical protein
VYAIRAFVTITGQEGLWWHRDERITPNHEVLPGHCDRRGKGGSSSFDNVLKEEQERKREMHGGSEGKTEANGGEALRIKAILVTTTKLTSSPKAPFTVEERPKTTISKVGVRVNPLGVHALFSITIFPLGFSEWSFWRGVWAEGLEGVS